MGVEEVQDEEGEQDEEDGEDGEIRVVTVHMHILVYLFCRL